MKTIRIIFVCMAIVAYAFKANAQTVYFLSMFDTKDKNIGKGMTTECNLVNNEFTTIAGFLEQFGYDCDIRSFYGDNCGKAKLMSVINGLQVGQDDVVVFYYGGHGARDPREKQDLFPQMCLGERMTSNYVPATLVRNMIAKKNPRLTIVLTGCCNSESNVGVKSVIAQSMGYTSQENINPEAYKKLFLETKGVVQMTSSKAGEYSFCIDAGSYFALVLLDALSDVGTGALASTWEAVCDRVKTSIAMMNMQTTDGVYKQNPYYKLDIVKGTKVDNNNNNNNNNIRRRDNDVVDALSPDLAWLVDKTINVNTRLQKIGTILSKHFAAGAMVMTVGRDMKTVVDYEDSETFLRRITMSPYISQINVVQQTGGRNSMITVHEVRTR